MKKFKFNLNEVIFKDLMENNIVINGVEKVIGNLLFMNAGTIEQDTVARAIFNSNLATPVEIAKPELDWMEQTFAGSQLLQYVKSGLSEYIQYIQNPVVDSALIADLEIDDDLAPTLEDDDYSKKERQALKNLLKKHLPDFKVRKSHSNSELKDVLDKNTDLLTYEDLESLGYVKKESFVDGFYKAPPTPTNNELEEMYDCKDSEELSPSVEPKVVGLGLDRDNKPMDESSIYHGKEYKKGVHVQRP